MAERIRNAAVPPALPDAVRAAYGRLPDAAAVAVRYSFAGMNASFTNVRDPEEALHRIVDCWASLVGPRVVTYRDARGLAAEPAIAVVVQVMVAAERAGVAFTADPRTGDRDTIVVEALLSQGEVVVSGVVEPDTYEVTADGLRLRAVRVGHQTRRIVRGPDGSDLVETLDPDRGDSRKLSDTEVGDVARLALMVHQHNGTPQDVEWAMDGGRLWLVQARPITTLRATGGHDDPLVIGLPAAPGRVSGRVRVLRSPAEGAALAAGEVLVAPMTDPDWLPTMRRAAAVVTDSGGATCHAAIAARELGVPCVVGTRAATTTPRDGRLVTVDGATGEVLDGDRTTRRAATVTAGPTPPASAAPETIGTRLYVNVAMPGSAATVAALPGVDGVGLLHAEFMLTDALGGRHPRELIARGEQEQFVAAMAASLLQVTEAFAPPARGVPGHGPAQQRVPGARGRRGPRTRRAQPDDRLPGGVPVPAGTRPVRPGAAGARRGPGAHAEPAPDDPVRAHPVGARGVPGPGRREPVGPRAGCTGG
jgi:pyruvate, water dikinase